MSVKQASKNYSIPRTTLIRHLKSKVGSPGNANLARFRTAFSKDTKEKLVNYIKDTHLRFFGLTRDAVCSLAYDYATINKLNVPFNEEKKKKQDLIGLSPFLKDILISL